MTSSINNRDFVKAAEMWAAESEKLGIQLHPEFLDFIHIFFHGARKYAPNNWIAVDGKNSDHKNMHASLFRHIAESSTGGVADHETKLHPLLHAACRCIMLYTRFKLNIKHPIDGGK